MKTPRLSILTSVYKGEVYLPTYFAQLESQTLFPDIEVVFICNQPSQKERRLVSDFQNKHSSQVQVHTVEREPLGASWNRAWRLASAPLLAPWNIDDRRTPDSLQRQVEAMEQHGWALCYGDYVTVRAYGEEAGEHRSTPAYFAGHFTRAFAQGGAFWVLRKEVANQLGFFDEQLRIAADMDFSFRLAAARQPMGRVEGVLGYFTDAEQGLSTRAGGQEAAVERTVVQLRYAVFDKVAPSLRATANAFRIENIQNFGNWHSLEQFLPGYSRYVSIRKPLWMLGWLRRLLRTVLRRLGLLGWLHARFDKEI